MSSKALSKGSQCPPLQEGEMRVYSMRFCPYAQRILLLLHHFNLPHTVININLRDKPEWLLEKNPSGSVPVLEFEGSKILCESLIIAEFIDEKFGKSSLLGKDPYLKSKQKMLIEEFGGFSKSLHNGLKAKTDEEKEEHIRICKDMLEKFEKIINGKFFGENEPNFIDFNIWPWFDLIQIYETMIGKTFFESKNFPKLSEWIGNMKKLKPVMKCQVDPQWFIQFLKEYLDPSIPIPNYDIGL